MDICSNNSDRSIFLCHSEPDPVLPGVPIQYRVRGGVYGQSTIPSGDLVQPKPIQVDMFIQYSKYNKQTVKVTKSIKNIH